MDAINYGCTSFRISPLGQCIDVRGGNVENSLELRQNWGGDELGPQPLPLRQVVVVAMFVNRKSIVRAGGVGLDVWLRPGLIPQKIQ